MGLTSGHREPNFKPFVSRYETEEEFLKFIEDAEIIKGKCGSNPSSNSKGSNWADTEDLAEAIDRGRKGDTRIASKIKPKDIELTNHGNMTSTVYDTSGDFVSVGRYLSGEPECMGSIRKLGKPIINILVNSGYNAGIHSDTIEARGKAILEIMSGLEANGYGVEIVLGIITGKTSTTSICQEVYIKIKSSREYFNLNTLSFWLASSSVQRRLEFAYCERVSIEQQSLISSYGRAVDLPQKELDEMTDCIYFPIITDNSGSYKAAIQQIMEKYKA